MSHFLDVLASQAVTFSQLNQLLAQLIVNSLHRHNYWTARVVFCCTRLHAPPSFPRLVFHSAECPNVFVFTSMFRYFCHMGFTSEVLRLYGQMWRCGVKPDAFVFPLVIKSAGKSGIVFQTHVEKLGFGGDPYVRNVIMDMYAKYESIEIARKVFDGITVRMVADWNSMISGYWKWGNKDEACKLFNLMPENERNVVSWTAMVTGFSKVKDLNHARRYFDRMPEKSVVSWNAMLAGYAQNGFAEETLRLFKEMVGAGVRPDETTWVTIVSACSSCADPCLAQSLVKMIDEKRIHLNCFVKTALVDMHAKCGNIKAARKIFDELGTQRNLVTWNAMISGYTRVGDLGTARELFDKMPKRNVVSWNSMIAGFAQNGQSALAVELFKEMIDSGGTEPDEITMVSALSACGHLGALELGDWVVKYIAKNRIKLSISGYNSLVFMYARCGNMKEAKRVFHEMKERDAISYNTLISGFAAHGNGVEALSLISKMEEEGLEPDRVTYIGVLTACSHAGLVEEGQRIFKRIKEPSVDHYACVVDLMGRVGKLNEAKRLIDEMPMQPHAGVYGALLNASRIHRNVKLGEFAAEKLFELEPNNSGNFVLLSNIYASASRWKDVDSSRERMKKLGLNKTTGWSWVEHKGKMVKFIIGDCSHERSGDIYKLLEELREKMKRLGYVADKNCVLRDVEEEEKEEMVAVHSEKLAVCFALLVTRPGSVIRVVKNLRVCRDCHSAMKLISELEKREIIVRDNNRFHHFSDGMCSCRDYW
ncbi:PREDICTED: pentatricopeptide repeat-containing protein At1g14470 [Tarenaya hassleriana]|uniref:pentatricopeptide repeat-containing protein At1g14470 n=1 Tax=Tarenaya hassleriana TaxID=28532 RepID=UPI00053C8B50|nr:PREDICTED: pentatricopeptide repeat-containing protein At1g14470 [Tarenaya hassleriana]